MSYLAFTLGVLVTTLTHRVVTRRRKCDKCVEIYDASDWCGGTD